MYILGTYWGRAIGKGYRFHDFGIRNGIDSDHFSIQKGIDFRKFLHKEQINRQFLN